MRRHHLGVDARYLDASIQASLVMGLNDVSAEDFASANAAVIWSLRGWVAHLGPAIWPAIGTKDGVLLLKTKPRFVLGIGFHQPHGLMTVVELVGCSIRVPGLGQNKDVIATSERVGEDGAGANVDIGVVAWSLTSR